MHTNYGYLDPLLQHMDIQLFDDGHRGVFYIEQDQKKVGKLIYEWKNDSTIIIKHTEVNEMLKGMGAGKQLVKKAVEFAREKNLKIIPECPFAKKIFEIDASFADVLADS